MQDTLLKEAFEKALSEGAPKTGNGIATHIHDALEKLCDQPTTTDSIRGYYRRFENEEEFNISRTAKDHLAVYLGSKNYKEYLEKTGTKIVNKRRYVFVIIVLVLALVYLLYETSRKKCMIWQDDRYVKIHCEEANAKPVQPGLLQNFKKVTYECRTDFFFDAGGQPKVWYYKRGENDLELYSMPGKHPIVEKTLHAITPYMIEAHVCDSLN